MWGCLERNRDHSYAKMGEDSCRNNIVDKKTVADSHVTNGMHHNHQFQNHNMNGSTISSCSEADSESTTCIGDAEDNMIDEQDYQYGPGIVSKLRTKFLSITLKQNRGNVYNMRRSCSLENILDQKSVISPINACVSPSRFVSVNETKSPLMNSSWSNLKRAKSMDTLLLSVTEEDQLKTSNHDRCTTPESISERVPKVIRRKDGPLTRTTITICDEELPKPDTVKTYKRMFEPAESKKASANSNVRRRPPVLRATAKSGSTSSSKTIGTSGKINSGVTNPSLVSKTGPVVPKCKPSAKECDAKESSPKVISNTSKSEKKTVEGNRTAIKNSVNANLKKKELTTSNGVVKAEPIKIKHKEEISKRNIRSPKHLEGEGTSKPSVPPNKPILHSKNNVHPIAQALEKKNIRDKNLPIPKQITPIIEKVEKPVFKQILAKQNDKILKNISTNEKPEIIQNGVINELITKTNKSIENGTISVQKNVDVPTFQKKEDEIIKQDVSEPISIKPLVNGFYKLETSEESIEPQQQQPQQKHHPCTNNDTNGHLIIQNNEGPKEMPSKVHSVKPPGAIGNSNSMVFDFRGKEVVSHLAIIPAPFGCRKVISTASKKRGVLLDGKEPYALNGFTNGDAIGTDEDDDDFVDYSMPQPCGLIFEGENIKIGKGAILATRNKDLKIQFDEDVEKNTFVYPSESSYLSDDSSSMSSSDFSSLEDNAVKLTNGVIPTAKLRANTAIGTTVVGGLMSYTPSVLRTVDNFQPGIFRMPEKDDKKSKDGEQGSNEGEEENRERKEEQQNGNADISEMDSSMLKPADPEFISSWSLSANTSDLLF